MTDNSDVCARIGTLLQTRGQRLAVAESLTGGMVSQCFAAAPDSSSWYLGGIVAYHRDVKYGLLEVPEGPVVSQQAVLAMAAGVQRLTGAEVAAAVTGAGGPDGQDGQPPGTVWMAVVAGDDAIARQVRFDGDPPEVCEQATRSVVRLLADVMGNADI